MSSDGIQVSDFKPLDGGGRVGLCRKREVREDREDGEVREIRGRLERD